MHTIPTLAALAVLMLASSCEPQKTPPFLDNVRCSAMHPIQMVLSNNVLGLNLDCGGVLVNGVPLRATDTDEVNRFLRSSDESAMCFIQTKESMLVKCKFDKEAPASSQ